MDTKATLQTTDYVVFCCVLCLSLVAGIYYAYKERHHKTAYRFHRGGGKLKALPVAISLLVTFESSIFFLGYPSEVYVHGFIFWLYNVGMFLGYSGLLWISIPLFYQLQITSVYEYLEMRFDSILIRRIGTVFSTVFMTLYAGIVLFGAAIALESVSNISATSAIIGMVAITVAYTSLGGLKAVVVTDVIQGIIMIVAIFAVLIYGTISVGGIGNVIELNKPSGRMKMVDFDPNPFVRHSVWTLVLGGGVRCLGICFRQPAIQRLNSTRSEKEARKVVYIAVPAFMILQLLVMAEGLVAFAYFSDKGCDPLAAGTISNPNQVISYTVFDMFSSVPGVVGLFIAALICASLSTISSLLSSVSAIISEDIVKPLWKNNTDEKLTQVSKFIVLAFGIVCIGMGLMISKIKGPLSQISGSVLGAIDGPMVAMFLTAVFFKVTNRKGVITGLVVGLCCGLWLSLGYNFSPGRKRTPWLPLGPTDQCRDNNITANNSGVYSNTFYETYNVNTTTVKYETFESGIVPEVHNLVELQGLDNLYSISYMYFGLISMIVTMVVGLTVSMVTGPDSKEPVPPYLMLSLRRQLCFWLPRCGTESAENSNYNEVEVKFVRENSFKLNTNSVKSNTL